MSSIPRPIPAAPFLPPLGAMMRSAFFGASPKKAKPVKDVQVEAVIPAKLAGTWPTAPEPAPAGVDMTKLLAAAKVAPELSLIEWDGDRTRTAAPLPRLEFDTAAQPAPAAEQETASGDGLDMEQIDARCRKIRERYVSARFPGAVRTLADLHSSDRVIKAARLYFEDDEPELALELLEVAAQETPHESPVWLARLEILFLVRDADGFLAAARAFRNAHPRHEAWSEIERLGRALVPGEPFFGQTSGPRDHEHYGPWPHTPNWIQAPWDLTPEIAAADFHRAALRLAGRAQA